MPVLHFPIIFNDEVQLVSRTDDGFYVIRYTNNDGNKSVLWLPGTLDFHIVVDSKGRAAIEMVKEFINGQFIIQNK